MKPKSKEVQFRTGYELVKVSVILLPLITLLACNPFVTKAEKADSQYYADASACYQTAHRKEKVNVMMSGNTEHSFAFPITIDIPITYDAGTLRIA